MKKCAVCEVTKDYSAFHRNRSKGGYASWCKECRLIHDRKHKTDNRVKDLFEKSYKKRHENPNTRAKYIFNNAKRRALDRNETFSVTLIRIQFAIMLGECERTGIKFCLKLPYDGMKTNPFAPSIDKIDPNKSYSDSNIQIVLWCYNMGKQQLNRDEYEDFILKAAEHITKQRMKNA